jgi:hypothetical protein
MIIGKDKYLVLMEDALYDAQFIDNTYQDATREKQELRAALTKIISDAWQDGYDMARNT